MELMLLMVFVCILQTCDGWQTICSIKEMKSKFRRRFISTLNCAEKDSFEVSENLLLLAVENDSLQHKLDTERNPWLARLILVAAAAFYGTNFGCVKILDNALDPSLATTMRFTIATSLFSPYLFAVAKSNPSLFRGGLEVGTYCAIAYWAQAISLETTPASTTAFICSLAVIVVPILDSLFDKTKPSSILSSLTPALLAAAGVASLEIGGTSLPGIGDLWAFVQPICFGLAFWRVEYHMKNCSQPGEAQAFTGATMLVAAIGSLIWTMNDFVVPLLRLGGVSTLQSAWSLQYSALTSDWHVFAALIWTGVVTTALTEYVENIALRSLKAAEATVILSTEPLWGAAFASVALGETMGWNTLVGAVFILTACLWSSVFVAGDVPKSVAGKNLEVEIAIKEKK